MILGEFALLQASHSICFQAFPNLSSFLHETLLHHDSH